METSALNLLIVEDEASIGILMEMEFEELGYNVTLVGLVSEARAIIARSDCVIDLCIIDLHLPDGDGLTLLQSIKENFPNLPVILMTGHGNKATVIEALKLGACDYIEKPFSISNELFPIVHRAETTIRLQKENNSLNEQILHQAKLASLGELSATVLHDVRGPLSTIQVACEDMAEEIADVGNITAEAMDEHLKHIRKACDRIRKLVDHLRGHARQDKQEAQESRAVDLLIEDSLYLVQQKVRKLGAKVEKIIDGSAQSVELACFPNKFEQVIMNLCSNACDAMQPVERRVLTVSARRDVEFLYIAVSDTGTGMSKEIQEKIYENFFTTKPRGEGTGLGLKIVRNIVREHQGELLLESQEGQGTTFTIRLPASRTKVVEPKELPVSIPPVKAA